MPIVNAGTTRAIPSARTSKLASLRLVSGVDGYPITTFARSGAQTITDFEGVARTVVDGNPAFYGARTVTNLFTESEFRNGLADTGGWNGGGVTATTLEGFAGALQFPAGVATKSAYKTNAAVTIGNKYIFSCVIKMDDGSAPRMGYSGTNVDPNVDVLGWVNYQYPTSILSRVSLGNGLYRCSWYIQATTTNAIHGVLQNAQNSNKAFKVTAYQLVDVTGISPQFYNEYVATTTAMISRGFGSAMYKGFAYGDSFVSAALIPYGYNQSEYGFLENYGVGGRNSTDFVTYFDTDAAAHVTFPNFVAIISGVNDYILAGSDPNATTRANMQTLAGKIVALGATPVFCVMPPWKGYTTWNATRQGYIDSYNTWVRSYTSANGYGLLDLASVLSTDGQTLSAGYDSGDGLHPNSAGYAAIGNALFTLKPAVQQPIPATTLKGIALNASTSLSIATPTGIKSGYLDWTPTTLSGTQWLWGSYTSAAAQIGVFYDGANVTFRKRVSSTNNDASKALTAVAGTTYRIGWCVNADNTTDVFINEVKGTTNANTTAPTWAATIQIGADGNSANKQIGNIKNFNTYKYTLSAERL